MLEETGETLQDTDKMAVENAEPSEAENKEDAQDTDQAEVSKDGEKEPEKTDENPLKKRIDRQRAALAAANRQIAEMKAQLEGARPPAQVDDGAPKEADFENAEEYYKALGKWEAKQELTKAQKEEIARREQEQRAEVIKQRQEVFEKRQADFKKTVPDYDEAVEIVQDAITAANQNTVEFKAFSDALISSDDMPALLYHLGKNPDDLESMFKMNPVQIIRHLAKLEIKLQSEPEKPKKVAPPPSAVKGSGSGLKDLEKMTPNELLKWARS